MTGWYARAASFMNQSIIIHICPCAEAKSASPSPTEPIRSSKYAVELLSAVRGEGTPLTTLKVPILGQDFCPQHVASPDYYLMQQSIYRRRFYLGRCRFRLPLLWLLGDMVTFQTPSKWGLFPLRFRASKCAAGISGLINPELGTYTLARLGCNMFRGGICRSVPYLIGLFGALGRSGPWLRSEAVMRPISRDTVRSDAQCSRHRMPTFTK
ncbi:hypothetical protein F4861DRAFT_166440 [Xylaria intraflava]|nr:hypothetical protein F4861DRAFT_166440 [Xylaria intraflava]